MTISHYEPPRVSKNLFPYQLEDLLHVVEFDRSRQQFDVL